MSGVRTLLEGLEGTVLLVLAVSTWPLSRFLLSDLGADPDERERERPGDRSIGKIDVQATFDSGFRMEAEE
jgi:hypothetical protein